MYLAGKRGMDHGLTRGATVKLPVFIHSFIHARGKGSAAAAAAYTTKGHKFCASGPTC
jgi:hypothetical protein